MDERQRCIDAFQNNKYKVIIAIIQAGGVGISLHDIHGYHPRLSLISPTWTGYDIKQALGRIHRAGAKTPALQRLIFCANTYEDKINDIIKRKLRNIDAINNGDLMGPDFATKEMVELADHVSRDNLIILKKSQKVFKIKK